MVPFLLPVLLAADPTVTAVKTADAVEFRVGGAAAAKYQFNGTCPDGKGGTKPVPKPFVWPLLAPGGVPVTDFAPADHVWHKSVWFGHESVIPEGIELKDRNPNRQLKGVDFWTDASPATGRVVCVQVGEPKQVSANHASVSTRNEWRTADGVKVMDENRTIHFLELPAGRLLVFEIDLHASVATIAFGDTKDGTMAVRVNPAMRIHDSKNNPIPDGGRIATSGGKTSATPDKDNLPIWGDIADWHDYTGTVDGKPVGLAIFADPANPIPSGWHTRGYGLMAANPFARQGTGFPSQKGKTDLAKLAKDEHLTLRFGVYAHTGDTKAGQVAEAFQAFARGE